MLRLVGFFLLVFVALHVLRAIPVVGSVFQIPFIGFWIAAIIVSALLSRLAVSAVDRRKVTNLRRQLGAVETPHNQGKLGSLLLAQRNYRKAIPPLENAVRGEPDSAEWQYRLGCALLGDRRAADAVVPLTRTIELDEEYAYGAAMLRLVEALTRAGRAEQALELVARFERNHGPKPESEYRKGRALRALGRNDEARAAFKRVGDIASQLATYQKKSERGWALKAMVASWL